MDYMNKTLILTFAACQNKSCNNVMVNDDVQVETNEEFYLSLEKSHCLGSGIRVSSEDSTVTIFDSDSMQKQMDSC